MADVKVSADANLASPAAGDLIPIVDISEPADSDKNKTITWSQLGIGRYWTLDNTGSTLSVGDRIKSNNHAGITHTLPASFSQSAVAFSDIWIWNCDSNSDISVDPNGTDQIYVNGASDGAGAAITVKSGELCIIAPRTTDTEWDAFIVGAGVDWKAGTETGFHSLGIDDNATGEVLQVSDTEYIVSVADIYRNIDTGDLRISGGNAANSGFNIQLNGGADGTPDAAYFREGGTPALTYNVTADTWNFQAKDIRTAGDFIQGGTGLFCNGDNASITIMVGGSVLNNGGQLALYGGSHATKAGDIQFSQAGAVELEFGNSGNRWDFQANAIVTSAGLYLGERADHSQTPAAGSGEIWVKNDANQTLYFTDDAGTDHAIGGALASGGGLVWELVSSSDTIAAGEGFLANLSSGSITLPATITAGDELAINNINAATLTVADNGKTIEYKGTSYTADITMEQGETLWLIGKDANTWVII